MADCVFIHGGNIATDTWNGLTVASRSTRRTAGWAGACGIPSCPP